MSLNIKNARAVALVRELAARTGETQTSAIEGAVAARLAQLEATEGSAHRERRLANARAVLADLDTALTDESRASLLQAERDLHDESGLFR